MIVVRHKVVVPMANPRSEKDVSFGYRKAAPFRKRAVPQPIYVYQYLDCNNETSIIDPCELMHSHLHLWLHLISMILIVFLRPSVTLLICLAISHWLASTVDLNGT